MDSKATWFGDGIDEPRKWRPRAATEIITLGEVSARYELRRHAFDAARHCGGVETGGIDEQFAFEAHRRFSAGVQLESTHVRSRALDRRMERKRRARGFGI